MNHWSNYWAASKSLNSFAESETSKGYDAEIKEYWFNVFSTLKIGSRIVDIGCGNGALACLAAEYSNNNGSNFDIHGIDAADINPTKAMEGDLKSLELLRNITFHTNTPAEKLPFPAGSVDLFVSQFGIEYADLNQAIRQCHNCLTPTGSICFMAHHPDSFISQDAKAGLAILNDILHASPLFIQVDLLLEIAGQVKSSGQFNTWSKNNYNLSISRTIRWIMDSLQSKYSDEIYSVWLQDILNRIIPVMQHLPTSDPKGLRAHLANQFTLLEQHRVRLDEQIKATLSERSFDRLQEVCNSLNISYESTVFQIENSPFAWTVLIR